MKKITFKKGHKKSNGWYPNLLSYLLIFLLPFSLVSFIWYQTSSESIHHQIKLAAKNQLLQAKHAFESQLLQLDDLSHQIPYEASLDETQVFHPYYGLKAEESLKKYRMNSALIEEVYMYFYENPFELFSASGKISITAFLEGQDATTSEDKSYFYEKMNQKGHDIFRLGDMDNAKKKFFGYCVPLVDPEGRLYGTVFYQLKNTELATIFQNALPEDEDNLIILGPNNGILASANQNFLKEHLNTDEAITSLKSQSEIRLGQKNYMLKQMENEHLNYTYVLVMNPQKAMASVNHMQKKFMGLMLVILVVGFLSAIFLGKKSYRPVEKMNALLQEYGFSNKKKAIANFEDVTQQFTNFLSENKVLHEEISRQTPHARRQVLRNLLNGQVGKQEDLNTLLPAVEIHFLKGNFFVLVLQFPTLLEKEWTHLEEAFFSELSKKTGTGFVGYSTDVLTSGGIPMIFSLSDKTTAKEVTNNLVKDCQKYLGKTPLVGVGNSVFSLHELNRSYIEALAALDYGLANPQKAQIFYDDLKALTKDPAFRFPAQRQLILQQSLNQGNEEVAFETLTWLVENGQQEGMTLEIQKMYGFYLLNTITKAGTEILGANFIQKAEACTHFKTLGQLQRHLEILIGEICQEVRKRPSHEENQLQKNILTYIEKEFVSSQLSLESISEVFQLSVSYVSRFVKDETGLTFSKYIQQLRLEKVKRDLVETSLPIKEVIRNCGYYDVSNYTRKFRQSVGVTPGQYREMNRAGLKSEEA